jgi:hypothetical protein
MLRFFVVSAKNAPPPLEEVASDIKGISAGWDSQSIAMPAGALGKNVKIEFRFVSNDNGQEFGGFYVDDVKVTVP